MPKPAISGAYLCEVGRTPQKKSLCPYESRSHACGMNPRRGAIRFPDDPEIFSQTEAQQLVAEELVEKWEKERCVCCGITKAA